MITPQSSINLSNVQLQQQPSLTWYINKETNRIGGTITDLDAVAQAGDIILNVERFRWQIFQPYSGMEWEQLIGQNPGYVAAEMQRRLVEALTMDDRITGISNFAYTVSGNAFTASFDIDTVYGTIPKTTQIILS